MTAFHPGTPDPFIRMRLSGWIISLCLHGAAVMLAAFLTARIGLAPPSSSFRWDVTVVASAPATPSVTTDKPQIAATPSRITERRTLGTPHRATPADSSRSTKSALTSQSTVHEPQTSVPVTPSPPQESELTSQPSMIPPAPEPLESLREQPASEHSPPSTSAPPEEGREQHTSSPSPSKDSEPIAQPLSSQHTLPRTPEETPPPISTAALAPSTSTTPVTRKPDYGWLSGVLLPRIEALKQYPMDARLKHAEGRVVVRIVIQEDGQILSATIAKSSGHDILDQAALETIRKASPIMLTQPLEKSQITIQVPLSYQLGR